MQVLLLPSRLTVPLVCLRDFACARSSLTRLALQRTTRAAASTAHSDLQNASAQEVSDWRCSCCKRLQESLFVS